MASQEERNRQLVAGWQAISRNDPRPAEEYARGVLRENPDDIASLTNAHNLLGVALMLQSRNDEALRTLASALERDPRSAGTSLNLGNALNNLGRPREAIPHYKRAVELEPGMPQAHNNLAHAYEAVGLFDEAARSYREVLRIVPDDVGTHDNLGTALAHLSRHEEAVACYRAALARDPDYAPALNNLGVALCELDRHAEALPLFEKATQLDPTDAHAHNNLGNVLLKLRRAEAAAASYRRAVELVPGYAAALSNLGAALVALDRFEEALDCCRKALALDPAHADAHVNMGLAYQELRRFDEAIASHQRALAVRPDSAEAHSNLGLIYLRQGRMHEATESLRKALSIRPGYVEALLHLGTVCQEIGRFEESAEHFRKAIALAPASADAHHNLGIALRALSRDDEAIASFREALRIDPEHKYTLGALLWSELSTCRWGSLAPEIEELRAGVRRGKALIEPFAFFAVSEDLEEQRQCAMRYFEDRVGTGRTRLWNGARFRHERIRVAYLSADFREHAVAYCIAELIELHDRSTFEVIGASFGIDDGSATRARLVRGFDRVLDLRGTGDFDAAKRLSEAEVDIVVDLMGYTRSSRPGILAHRPAPIQVGYLGHPGTVGADFLDYILADRFVVPPEHQRFYSERIAYLPDSYQANDSKREIAPRVPNRAEAGLPDTGFVFCCFNNSYKVGPAIFDIWMRLLSRLPGSVLWILEDNAAAGANLRGEAQARGVDPRRLVLAQRVGAAEYRSRCRLADLVLDTLPYNGHGTAGDMLWLGLPVLTCVGHTFAGRVAGGLLHAAGLPELVTTSLEDYEALALRLASGDGLLAELRARLERTRTSAALFDSDRFRRHMESAFRTMWETWQRGGPPRTFAVEPIL
jgi:predicted O-linked N-acetylglucosamine transferase (SPINDLY family)